MNLDRFDGYPGGEEQRQKKPTALERWLALGFDPAGEVGGSGRFDIACSMYQLEKRGFATADAIEVRE